MGFKKMVVLTVLCFISIQAHGDGQIEPLYSKNEQRQEMVSCAETTFFLQRRLHEVRNIPKKLFILPLLSTLVSPLLELSCHEAIHFFGVYSGFVVGGYLVYCSAKEGYSHFKKPIKNTDLDFEDA